MWITNCGIADLYTVFAKIDGEKFSAFLVERTSPGLTVGAEEHKLGIRGSSTCPLVLAGCRIPAANLLGEAGKGHHIAFNVLNMGRFKLGVACIGGARHALGHMVRYAKERNAFGKPIAEFGLIQRKISTSAARLYAAESMAYRTVGMIDAGLAHWAGAGSLAARDAAAHRGVRRRVLHPEGLWIGDAEPGGRRADRHHGRLRLHGGVSGGALLSRCAHQPHL